MESPLWGGVCARAYTVHATSDIGPAGQVQYSNGYAVANHDPGHCYHKLHAGDQRNLTNSRNVASAPPSGVLQRDYAAPCKEARPL